MPSRRYLTASEIEYVLSAISSFRLDPKAYAEEDAPVLESLRLTLRDPLSKVEIPDDPEYVDFLRQKLRVAFLCSLICPGINEGARAASANSEPLTQEILKAVQSAGVQKQEIPIIDILKMKEELACEFFFTVPECGAAPVEYYIEKSMTGRAISRAPGDADSFLKFGFDAIVSPVGSLIVKTSNGSYATPIHVVFQKHHPLLENVDWKDWNMTIGKNLIFYGINFSMQETLKLRLSPFKILEQVGDYVKDGAVAHGAQWHVSLNYINTEQFGIVILTSNATLTLALAMGTVGIGKDVKAFTSFELLQRPTMQVVTAIDEIAHAKMGLLAPTRFDGKPARSWIFHMTSPNYQIPAKHVCAFLDALGFRILEGDKTASGRWLSLHVAEHKYPVIGPVDKWIDAEAKIASLWYFITATPRTYEHIVIDKNPYRDPVEVLLDQGMELEDAQTYVSRWNSSRDPYGSFRSDSTFELREFKDPRSGHNLVDWIDLSTSPFWKYSVFYSLKFAGHRDCLERIFASPKFDWSCSRGTNIPVTSKILCAPVARQLMDYMWVTQVASKKVSQLAADYVTLYGAGTGPIVQPVNQSAIRAAGPLNGLTENPESVLLDAAILSETYGNTGAVPSVVTGSMSRESGTGSVTVAVETRTTIPAHVKYAMDGLSQEARFYDKYTTE